MERLHGLIDRHPWGVPGGRSTCCCAGLGLRRRPRYLRLPALRREIHEGLNVVENWNSANDFILFGNGGDLATNRRDAQEITMLALHLLQNTLVYINTLIIQRVLSETTWATRLTPEDFRALTPLYMGTSVRMGPSIRYEEAPEPRAPSRCRPRQGARQTGDCAAGQTG